MVGVETTRIPQQWRAHRSLADEPPNHDSMPIFRRRVGGNPTWQEEDYEREHAGEAIQKLKDLGLTLVILHFCKGFGLEAERDHIQKALRLASIIKKHGLRLGVYGVLRLSAEGGLRLVRLFTATVQPKISTVAAERVPLPIAWQHALNSTGSFLTAGPQRAHLDLRRGCGNRGTQVLKPAWPTQIPMS